MSRGFFITNPRDSKRVLTVFIKDANGNKKKHLTLKPGDSKHVTKSPVFIEDELLPPKLTYENGKLTKDTKSSPPQYKQKPVQARSEAV